MEDFIETPDYSHLRRKPTLEQRLSRYKNRMEFIRTVIGVIVLAIQFVIVYNLITK
jgi:hypothetical protein